MRWQDCAARWARAISAPRSDGSRCALVLKRLRLEQRGVPKKANWWASDIGPHAWADMAGHPDPCNPCCRARAMPGGRIPASAMLAAQVGGARSPGGRFMSAALRQGCTGAVSAGKAGCDASYMTTLTCPLDARTGPAVQIHRPFFCACPRALTLQERSCLSAHT